MIRGIYTSSNLISSVFIWIKEQHASGRVSDGDSEFNLYKEKYRVGFEKRSWLELGSSVMYWTIAKNSFMASSFFCFSIYSSSNSLVRSLKESKSSLLLPSNYRRRGPIKLSLTANTYSETIISWEGSLVAVYASVESSKVDDP